jgi:protein-L-isoaspartate(D-aspartate) O-methyltransferase
MANIAKFNMVEQHIRPWNVHSPVLLAAISRLDRSIFVPSDQQALCYCDTSIALDNKTRMLAPRVAARLIQALELQAEDHVLVLGAGSGYVAALCAQLAKTVVCHDVSQRAIDRAANNCTLAGIENIGFMKVGSLDIAGGKVEFDAVLIRERRVEKPQAYLNKLSDGGRCVVKLGRNCVTELICYTRDGKDFKAESVIDILAPENDTSGDIDHRKTDFIF